mgnify:CR=1 FL=1
MNKHPGFKVLLRCDPHLAPHYMDSIPSWFTKMSIEVVSIDCKKIKHEVEIEIETRWDANRFNLGVVFQRLQSTKALRNVRLVDPPYTPK